MATNSDPDDRLDAAAYAEAMLRQVEDRPGRLTWLGTPRGDSIFRRFMDRLRIPRREPIDATGAPWTVGVDSGGPNGDHTAVARHHVDENGHHVVDIVVEAPVPLRTISATMEVNFSRDAEGQDLQELLGRTREEIRRAYEVPPDLLRAETGPDGGFLMPSDVARAMEERLFHTSRGRITEGPAPGPTVGEIRELYDELYDELHRELLEEVRLTREELGAAYGGPALRELPGDMMTTEETEVLRRAEVELSQGIRRSYFGRPITPELIQELRDELRAGYTPPASPEITWGEEEVDSRGRLYLRLRSGPVPIDTVTDIRGVPIRRLPVQSPRSRGVNYTLPRMGDLPEGPEYHPAERARETYRRLCESAVLEFTAPRGTLVSHNFRGVPFQMHGTSHEIGPIEHQPHNPLEPRMTPEEYRQNITHAQWEGKHWLQGADFTGTFEEVTDYLKMRLKCPLEGTGADNAPEEAHND